MFTQLRGNIIEHQGLLSFIINLLNLTFSHFGKRKVNNESVNRDSGTDYHQRFYFSQLDIQLGNNHEFPTNNLNCQKTQGISYCARH